jgi:hypothetical protein
LRQGLAQLVAFVRQIHSHRGIHDRNRDQEDDQQHQHHVHQRRGVDLGQHAVVGIRSTQTGLKGFSSFAISAKLFCRGRFSM